MSISFPYWQKPIDGKTVCDPIATLSVKTTFGVQHLDFLVDSGADTTTLPLAWAHFFDFKPIKRRKEWISGVEDGKIEAFPSKIEIGFGKNFYRVRCLFINSNVIPLLGRLDIWGKFSIFFDNIRGKTVFYPMRK